MMHPLVAYLGGLAAFAAAEQVLIPPNLGGTEQFSILGTGVLGNSESQLGLSVATPDADAWRAMTVEDFMSFGVILVGDACKDDETRKLLSDTKDIWSAAVTGNIAVAGLESLVSLSDDFSYEVLQKNLINFALNGVGTGLYYAVPCHDTDDPILLEDLSHFGNITVQRNPTNIGRGSLTNIPHLVANDPAFITIIDDTSIGPIDFGQDVSNIFLDFPEHGPTGFEAAVISTKSGSTVGSRTFLDGTSGAPFVITRGAVPLGCGNGVRDGAIGEECDPEDPLLLGHPDVCDQSCKCVIDFPGVCPPAALPPTSSAPPPSSTSTTSTSSSGPSPPASTSTTDSGSKNSTYVPSSTKAGGSGGGSGPIGGSDSTTSTYKPPSSTGSGGSGGQGGKSESPSISYVTVTSGAPGYSNTLYPATVTDTREVVGIEIIFIIEIVETCPAGQTVTVTETKTVSTVTREIHHTKTEGYPCYPCAFGQPRGEITTVYYDLCPTISTFYPTYTAQLCHSCPCMYLLVSSL
ncbi:hypothetical protein GQ53DRAFT_36234 [Thozetella sp. PMI_491]|nr:hypothetical protein GQ53DRAFT_36234 [Thozetella sp. PMI_491]